jgi:exopolysaccharide biosynthesis protein YbjH
LRKGSFMKINFPLTKITIARSILLSGRGARIALIFAATLSLVLSLDPAEAPAGDFHNAPSLQGFTGLLNTPNAEVTDDGKFDALYSKQIEDRFRAQTAREESYVFSIGFLPFAELGGRLTEAPGVMRDLSANIKVRVPFIPRGYYLPDVAFGVQDIGGGVKLLQTKYAVLSEELWRLRLSLGYGSGPDRMKGVFGGAELKVFEWLYLIGENDTRETNAGARLVVPELFGVPVKLQATAKTSLDYRPGKMEYAFGLQIPLGSDRHNTAPSQKYNNGTDALSALSTTPGARQLPAPTPGSPKAEKGVGAAGPDLQHLLTKLTSHGFQNVKIGYRGEWLLVVEYENSRYNHNELDGLGVVVGLVVDAVPTGFETLRLIVKKQDIRVLQLSAPLRDFKAFLLDAGTEGELNKHLRITTDVEDDNGVRFIAGPRNPSWLRSALVLYPGLKTYVGTEVGVFDYLLSAKLDYYLNVWKGAALNARWDVPVTWSENFAAGKEFGSNRKTTEFERLMLFQAIKASPDVMINLGGGMVLHDAYGVVNEVMWTPGDGTHRFTVKQASVTSNSIDQPRKREAYLGSYRYYLSPLDLYLVGTGGKFFDQDKGGVAELKRFFGDTNVSLYFKYSDTPVGEHVKVAGVLFSFPLTPRRDMKPYPLQLKGSNEWGYFEETRVAGAGEKNFLGTSIGVDPRLPYNLERVFYNRDRLSEPYIRKHLLRLRDAYLTYGQNEN